MRYEIAVRVLSQRYSNMLNLALQKVDRMTTKLENLVDLHNLSLLWP